jgi:hypothetical protein
VTVWDDTFADDQDAYDEFYRTLESEGIRSLGAPVEKGILAPQTREALVPKLPAPFPS